jgi:hypothetical protein
MPTEIIPALHAVLRATEIDTIILGIARLARASPQLVAVLTAILARDKRSRASRSIAVLKILRRDGPPPLPAELARPGTRTAGHHKPMARTRRRGANKAAQLRKPSQDAEASKTG